MFILDIDVVACLAAKPTEETNLESDCLACVVCAFACAASTVIAFPLLLIYDTFAVDGALFKLATETLRPILVAAEALYDI